MPRYTPLYTGQNQCYDGRGNPVFCEGSGQDGEFRLGLPWPSQRLLDNGDTVTDFLTGLVWTKSANLHGFPVTWQEALELIRQMNTDGIYGHNDWRLPNRRELHSLMDYGTRKPSLPAGHPFADCFLGWYWTSTSAAINPAYAWYIHLEGARMFYGRKDQYYLFWPVRGQSSNLLGTGQVVCYDAAGLAIQCAESGQDGEFQQGLTWAENRFAVDGEVVLDNLTGIIWPRDADISGKRMSWPQALQMVNNLNAKGFGSRKTWMLPNINAIESLVDCSRHGPALPANHPFVNVQEIYWSSTTSMFETDWAWALYLEKGALGVGYKIDALFSVWPASYPEE